jgi:hypothetical protein
LAAAEEQELMLRQQEEMVEHRHSEQSLAQVAREVLQPTVGFPVALVEEAQEEILILTGHEEDRIIIPMLVPYLLREEADHHLAREWQQAYLTMAYFQVQVPVDQSQMDLPEPQVQRVI